MTAPSGSTANGLSAPARLVDSDGSHRLEALSADAQVAWYARIVHRGQHGLVEVVRATRQRDGGLRMRSRRDPRGYLEAGDAHALCRLAGLARGQGEEVFATPLPRERPEPGKHAVASGSAVWVDLDETDAERLREAGRLRLDLWVASGAGQHLYWRLADELPPAELEGLNRRLCHRLGGDPACCEYGRIMRLPGTFNRKRGQWCRIVRADRARPPVGPAAIRAALPDPEPERHNGTLGRQGRWSEPLDDALAEVAPPAYFLSLAAVRVPDAGGMVRCPLPDHDDAYASCQVYPEPGQGLHLDRLDRAREREGARTLEPRSIGIQRPWQRGDREDPLHAGVAPYNRGGTSASRRAASPPGPSTSPTPSSVPPSGGVSSREDAGDIAVGVPGVPCSRVEGGHQDRGQLHPRRGLPPRPEQHRR